MNTGLTNTKVIRMHQVVPTAQLADCDEEASHFLLGPLETHLDKCMDRQSWSHKLRTGMLENCYKTLSLKSQNS